MTREPSIQYDKLADAADHLDCPIYREGDVEIWYARPAAQRDLIMGSQFWSDFPQSVDDKLTVDELKESHVLLGTIDIDSSMETRRRLEKAYQAMRAENWSPRGEAREMIKSKGLQHTTMSVGDIVRLEDSVHIVDTIGFVELEFDEED